KVEDRAANEGLPPVGSPDTPIAVLIEGEATEAAPSVESAPAPEAVEAPKRRRVRRKVTSAAAEETNTAAVEQVAAPVVAAAETEVEAAPVPVELDVTPAVAARIEQAIEEALVEEVVAEEAVVLAEPVPAPTAEVDIAAIIADDPNQIGEAPAKPKRGWWRR
ncbi:MAG TPA: ribonuclease E/G, partial [Brevundimonas sp.]|nr:ribonuclease E/G [Brevundimonas sp.]